MHLENFQVDKIQSGRLSAIIHLDRPDIVEYHENRSRYLHHYYDSVSGRMKNVLATVAKTSEKF